MVDIVDCSKEYCISRSEGMLYQISTNYHAKYINVTDFVSSQSLTLYDPSPASVMDLSSQFFLREADVTAQANRYMENLKRYIYVIVL